MDAFQAIIIAIVEGLTEFLPVSSTGHMILAADFLNVDSNSFSKSFIVNIQFGAILAVVALYHKRFFKSMEFYYKLAVAFIPAAVFGLLLDDYIDAMLSDVTIVAGALLLGGIVLIFIDGYFERKNPGIKSENESPISYKHAFFIGIFQCFAMIPGVSRSASSIIGGMFQGLNRKTAAEFSFFLAVPTMFAASALKLIKNPDSISSDHIGILLIGNIVAFIVAILAIKFFIAILNKYGFKIFGYYRIILGAVLLILLAAGIELSMV